MDEIKSTKVYGLSFPTRKSIEKPKQTIQSVFNEESDEELEPAKLKPLPSTNSTTAYRAKIHRKTKSDFEKALAEDPSVFQYDEIYEDISSEKIRDFTNPLSGTKKQAKYVDRLMKTATERKLERELCAERKAQKEIEAEEDQYGDKESFVTSAYKEKLSEMQNLMAKREVEEQREKVMDITSQAGLGGFYRYMYDHGIDKNNPRSTHHSINMSLESSGDVKSEKAESTDHGKYKKTSPTKESRDTSRKSRYSKNSAQSSDVCSKKESELPVKSSSALRNLSDNEGKASEKVTERSLSQSPENKSSRKPHANNAIKEEHSNSKKPPEDKKESKTESSKQPPDRDPNFVYARPHVTTDEQIEEARQRYFARKAAGIVPTIVDSDSD